MDTVESKNKLVRSITPEELAAFLDELANTPGVDGPMIQEQALEKFGIKIGHESANNFRKEVFGKYIERMRRRKELSAVVAANRDSGNGRTLADAASEELQQQVFEFLADNAPLNLADDKYMERAESLSRIIKSARSEDRRMIDQLADRVKQLEDEKKQTAAGVLSAAKEAGASPALINSVREALNFRPPQEAQPVEVRQ
jgi:hypothetical protein